jgi:N-acetylglucosaminyldiphosphoundecaprenol N-acetyl-beta-D-mannosaminyltransferase
MQTRPDMVASAERHTVSVIGSPIDALTWEHAIARIRGWARARSSRYVCICNVHSVVTASRDTAFAQVLRQADMATPDGAPVAWMMRRMGQTQQVRISGPDLMWRICASAPADEGAFLYGSTEQTLSLLCERLRASFPHLTISGAYSPPFRPLSDDEDERIVEMINASGAGLVWVSLGCPKQEQWMARHRGRINAVMLGVGAAFDFHAGTAPRAPLWMRNAGLEWLHRLLSEPRRLWRRYLVTNTLFILQAAKDLLAGRAAPQDRTPHQR